MHSWMYLIINYEREKYSHHHLFVPCIVISMMIHFLGWGRKRKWEIFIIVSFSFVNHSKICVYNIENHINHWWVQQQRRNPILNKIFIALHLYINKCKFPNMRYMCINMHSNPSSLFVDYQILTTFYKSGYKLGGKCITKYFLEIIKKLVRGFTS